MSAAPDPYYHDEAVALYRGDCIEVMRALPEASVDAVVCDPPYGIEFMGKAWDSFRVDDPGTDRFRGDHAGVHGEASSGDGGTRDAFRNDHGCEPGTRWARELIDPYAAPPTSLAFQNWCRTWAIEAYRVLKPGGHLLAFGAPRLYHRLASGIEDAGFEVRDSLLWLYISGFPKSLDVAKAIDKDAGHWRVRASGLSTENGSMSGPNYERTDNGEPVTDEAAAWVGWGTALKPAYEPVVLGRKPLAGTVIATVTQWGTGALNIDGTRIEMSDADRDKIDAASWNAEGLERTTFSAFGDDGTTKPMAAHSGGRWPANVMLDEGAAALIDAEARAPISRAFYSAKTSTNEREAGLEALGAGVINEDTPPGSAGANSPGAGAGRSGVRRNTHPTVKPVDLMRWLCRLVTPPGGVVLDPFLGSGTTAMAALDEGFRCIGIEREERYIETARHRVTHRHLLELQQVEAQADIPQGRLF